MTLSDLPTLWASGSRSPTRAAARPAVRLIFMLPVYSARPWRKLGLLTWWRRTSGCVTRSSLCCTNALSFGPMLTDPVPRRRSAGGPLVPSSRRLASGCICCSTTTPKDMFSSSP